MYKSSTFLNVSKLFWLIIEESEQSTTTVTPQNGIKQVAESQRTGGEETEPRDEASVADTSGGEEYSHQQIRFRCNRDGKNQKLVSENWTDWTRLLS